MFSGKIRATCRWVKRSAAAWLAGGLCWLGVVVMPASAELVAVSIPKFNDTFQTLLRESMEKEADFNGVEMYVGDAEDDPDLQLEQIQHYINMEVDGLIVVLADGDEKFATAIAQMAQPSGIPVVFLNHLPRMKTLPEGTWYVGGDETLSGAMEMQELARLAQYRGKVGLLKGAKGEHAAEARTKYTKYVISDYGDMELVAEEHANWRRSEAVSIVKEWLKKHPDMRVIVANNDEMAIGAAMAVDSLGLSQDDILIGGVDATPDALQAMEDGKLDVTVLQDASAQGSGALTQIINLWSDVEIRKETLYPFKLVTPSTIHKFR
jgi:ABC-type sugar transport system substrate-binding protein